MENDTTLAEANGQMILISSAEMEGALFSADELQGKYTTERLKKLRPQIYQLCISLLGEGISKRQINRALGLHHYTICAVEGSVPSLIEAEKKRIGSLSRSAVGMCVETIIDAIQDAQVKGVSLADAQRVAIIMGILAEKSELLLGGATQRIARPVEDMSKIRDALYTLPDGPAIDAEFSDVPGITGFDAGAREQKEPRSPAPDSAPDPPSRDILSPDSSS